MDVSVDVGPNITSMLERLAEQIGVTSDKVFPWYVQQSYIEGVTTLSALLLFWLIGALVVILNIRKAEIENSKGPNRYAVACIAGTVLMVFLLLPTGFEGTESVRKILNPNYYAMKMLTRDIGNLTARR